MMIVVHIGLKNTTQMPLAEHDDIIETLAPDAPNDPLTVWILPGTVGRNLHLFNAQVADSVLERGAVDGNLGPAAGNVARCSTETPRRSAGRSTGWLDAR